MPRVQAAARHCPLCAHTRRTVAQTIKCRLVPTWHLRLPTLQFSACKHPPVPTPIDKAPRARVSGGSRLSTFLLLSLHAVKHKPPPPLTSLHLCTHSHACTCKLAQRHTPLGPRLEACGTGTAHFRHRHSHGHSHSLYSECPRHSSSACAGRHTRTAIALQRRRPGQGNSTPNPHKRFWAQRSALRRHCFQSSYNRRWTQSAKRAFAAATHSPGRACSGSGSLAAQARRPGRPGSRLHVICARTVV